jgi:hypothetical protein
MRKRRQFEQETVRMPANFDSLAEAEADLASKAQRTRFEHMQGTAAQAFTGDEANG